MALEEGSTGVGKKTRSADFLKQATSSGGILNLKFDSPRVSFASLLTSSSSCNNSSYSVRAISYWTSLSFKLCFKPVEMEKKSLET